MHLRTIRLRGFKSFAEAAELQFEPGISVIVGPNGSGKSNVAEALQWAMASQPPTEMRAQVAADVLFDGSARRPPAGLCEVELVLDNASGRFGSGRPEISIMRRLRRDGDAEYLLNRLAVRRLDVQEALADAGLGREMHAIVNQGRIDEILLSRPADRRGYIEEAAGLGKYKRRRHRALLKLHRTEQNLSRARDLEGELKARLRPLALQASAAERAEALAGEIDAARLELTGSRIAAGRRSRTRIAADLEGARARVAAVDAQIAETDRERAAVEEELTGLLARQEEASGRYYGLATGLDRLAARREALEERRAALLDAERRALARAERLEADATAAATAAAEASAETDALSAELAAAPEGAGDAELERAAAETAAAFALALAARQELAELDGRAARAARDAEESDEQATAAARRAAATADEADRLTAERDGLAALVTEAQAALDEASGVHAVAVAARRDGEQAAATARERDATARADHAAAGVAARAGAARLSAAKRAAERGDGLAPAVRALREHGLSLTLDLVDAPTELASAAAAAVAWRAGEAVAASASDAFALLADEALAGAVIACLDRLPSRVSPGAGTPLARLVRLRDGTPAALLDGVVLVDDAAELGSISTGVAVTRDGRGFDADRGVAFRTSGSAAAVIELRRELEAATAEADAAFAALAAAEAESTQTAAALGLAQSGADAASAAVSESTTRLERATTAAREAARSAEAVALRADRAAHQLQTAHDEETRLRQRSAAAAVEARELAGHRAELAERSTTLASGHERLEERRRELAEREAVRRAERAAALERLERRRADRARHAETADLAGQGARRLRDRATALSAFAALLPRGVATLEGAGLRIEALRAPERERLRELEARAGELSRRLADASNRAQELQGGAREATARATALEVEAAHAEEQLTQLVRMRSEVLARTGGEPVERLEPLPATEEAALEARIDRLERRREQLGAVNPLAREEYDEARLRHEETAEQIGDLEASMRELRRLIRDLTATITERFDATYQDVERHFGDTIGTLFPGGRGRLRLVEGEATAGTDEEGEAPPEPAEPGVELEISPAGKQISRLQMLSGGEKALGAIAFLFAIMLARPCPFYVLDEVDAALDDINVDRFLQLVERYRDRAQFIVITHQKRTMEAADVLYGVTMANDGISKVVSRRLPPARREAPDLVTT
jgi:chromosome segregation protein